MVLTNGLSRMSGRLSCPVLRGGRSGNAPFLPDWGGFTTQDLARCQLMARMVALAYNCWTLFVRLAQPDKHLEAITSRPLLLHGVATQTRHGGQTRLMITSTHAKQAKIQSVLKNLTVFLSTLKDTAEQLTDAQRLQPA